MLEVSPLTVSPCSLVLIIISKQNFLKMIQYNMRLFVEFLHVTYGHGACFAMCNTIPVFQNTVVCETHPCVQEISKRVFIRYPEFS